MLTDLHVHTKAISKCCLINAKLTIQLAKKKGFDALAITNHYVSDYFQKGKDKAFSQRKYDKWIDSYIKEWENCRKIGKRYGVHIFCGIEVTLESNRLSHILIYGADKSFLRNNPLLCYKSLEELYKICKANGCALVQGHPFRGGSVIQDPQYLDGVEINCHPLYKNSFYKEIIERAKQEHLAVTVGCDYHADTYRAVGGSILPDTVKTDKDLAQFILTSKSFVLQVHEPANNEIFKIDYER